MRHPHIGDFLSGGRPVGWIEVHSENFVGDGGPDLAALLAIRRDLPVACHGVGLSLGSVDGLDDAHLALLGRLYDRLEPRSSRSISPGPSATASISTTCCRCLGPRGRFRSSAGTSMLRNPDSAVASSSRIPRRFAFPQSAIPEWEFAGEVVCRTRCGLLLDVNNIYVSAHNLAFSAAEYLEKIPHAVVDEIHLAGHSLCRRGTEVVRIDDHGSAVCDDVWALYAGVLKRTGPVPTLIEWDTNIPALPVLLAEANAADRLLERHGKVLTDVA